MKRLPLLCSFLAFVLLCATLSFWVLRVLTPAARGVAAPTVQNSLEPGTGDWAGLFGAGPQALAAASNYQLQGVIIAGNPAESLAIVSANGKPAQTLAIKREFAPGISLQEVRAQYIMIADGAALQRVELPQASANPSHGAEPFVAPLPAAEVRGGAVSSYPAHRNQMPPPQNVPALGAGFPSAGLPPVSSDAR